MITISGRRYHAAVIVQEAVKHDANRLSEHVAAVRAALQTIPVFGICRECFGHTEPDNAPNCRLIWRFAT